MTPQREHSHRAERVADVIRRELGGLLEREVKDPRVGFVTVTHVEVTRDLRSARVAVTILGDEPQEKESLMGLAAAQGFLRHELAQRLGLRRAPELQFYLDRTLKSEQRIEELLRQIQQKP
ncbi:MAG: 30S ribosome-binding factor RbfA [Acidobacteria bacterium]|nr:30S ribosome-binding factor RbfA [Acidobacteriota bacterium]